jgi:hypothetical protein
MKWINRIFVAILFILMQNSVAHSISHYEILSAMRDEVKRSMDSLFIETLQKPYYVEYTLKISNTYRASALLGSLVDTASAKTITLNVQVRVGDYNFDNANFLDFSLFFFMGDGEASGSRRLVPVDLDYYSLRRELWLATDIAYKKAVETYSKKLGIMKNRLMKDTLPDFAKAMPTVSLDTNFSFPKFNFEEYCEIVKDISKIYRDYPEIHNSSVSFEYFQDVIYYINSEGTEFVKTKQFTGFEIAGASQCEDGMPIYNFYSAYADEPAKLPQKDSLRKATEILCKNLSKMYEVKPLEDSYSGPILFVGQASAELFAQVFAPNLVAQRKSLSEQGLQSFSPLYSFSNKNWWSSPSRVHFGLFLSFEKRLQ